MEARQYVRQEIRGALQIVPRPFHRQYIRARRNQPDGIAQFFDRPEGVRGPMDEQGRRRTRAPRRIA